jgi:hypothetical protein
MIRHRKFLYLFFALLALPAVSWAEEGVVLAIRPEGAVVDIGQMPEVQQGSKLGFIHLNGDRKETGQGWVLDVKEGRALVGLTPGGAVKKGDRAILCPKPGEDPYQELRTMVDQLRNQAAQPGAQMTSEIQAMTNQVQSALGARDAAIQRGSCDTAEYDRQISALATDLQNLSARLQPVAMGPSLQEGAPPGTPSIETPPLQEPLPPGTSPMEGSPQGGIDVVSKLSELLQALGGKFGTGGGGESGGGAAPPSVGWSEPSPSSGAAPPSPEPDPGVPGGAGEEAKAQDPTKPPIKVIDPSKIKLKPIPLPTKEEAKKDKPQPSPEAKVPWWQAPKIQPAQPSTPVTPAGPQAVTPQKEIFKPGIGPIAKVTPGQIKLASVTGKVLNEQGKPVPGAKVAVGGAGSVLTNSQGKFTVQNLKPGKHQVTATAPGYKAETRKITLEPGEVESVEFTLKKMAASPEKPLHKPMSPVPWNIPKQ